MTILDYDSFGGVETYDQMVNSEYANVEANANRFRADAGLSTAFGLEDSGIGTRRCLRKLTNANVNVRRRTIPGAQTEVIKGFRFKPGTLGASADGFFALYDQAGTVIFRLNHASATVQVQYGSSAGVSTQFTTGSILSTSRWDYFEVHYKMSDAAAITIVKMNNVVLFSSVADNKQTASTSIATYGFGVNGQNSTGGVDDRWMDSYLLNTAGSAPYNTFLGPVKIHAFLPEADEAAQWVGSDADSVDNFQHLNERNRSASDFVETNTDGNRDTYEFVDGSFLGNIAAVQLVVHGGAPNPSDPKDLNAVFKLAGNTDTALMDLTTIIREVAALRETKPGGGAWTAADVNDATAGFELVDA